MSHQYRSLRKTTSQPMQGAKGGGSRPIEQSINPLPHRSTPHFCTLHLTRAPALCVALTSPEVMAW